MRDIRMVDITGKKLIFREAVIDFIKAIKENAPSTVTMEDIYFIKLIITALMTTITQKRWINIIENLDK